MTAEERFSIRELIKRTGTPAATIHHYRRSGLLPPPRRVAANRFLYDERHVRALQVIRSIRARHNVPLATIRRQMPRLMSAFDGRFLAPEALDTLVGRSDQGSGRRGPADRLLSAAITGFARRGYAGVNVDEICRTARVAKGSFYRHYRSKEELFFAAADAARADVIAEFGRALSQDP